MIVLLTNFYIRRPAEHKLRWRFMNGRENITRVPDALLSQNHFLKIQFYILLFLFDLLLTRNKIFLDVFHKNKTISSAMKPKSWCKMDSLLLNICHFLWFDLFLNCDIKLKISEWPQITTEIFKFHSKSFYIFLIPHLCIFE